MDLARCSVMAAAGLLSVLLAYCPVAEVAAQPKSPAPKPEAKSDVKPAAKPDAKVAKAEDEKPRFDFYKILPGAEEPLSERDLKRAEQKPAGAGSKEVYFLQAGAFQNAADADNMKARLALMGMEASIQTAAIPDKGMLHRVRVGPEAERADADRLSARLKGRGLPATVVPND